MSFKAELEMKNDFEVIPSRAVPAVPSILCQCLSVCFFGACWGARPEHPGRWTCISQAQQCLPEPCQRPACSPGGPHRPGRELRLWPPTAQHFFLKRGNSTTGEGGHLSGVLIQLHPTCTWSFRLFSLFLCQRE